MRRVYYVVAFFLVVHLRAEGQQVIRVAAAADLKFVLDSLTTVFTGKNPGVKVLLTYGSSGKLCEQIVRGAPFDVFFSADLGYVQRLKNHGVLRSEIIPYAKGRIVIWSNTMNVSGPGVLTSRDVGKLAIANPLHAPYGKRAEEYLKHRQIYAAVKPKLVFGENVAQAAQFVLSGAADAGIIALSLAMSPPMRETGNYFLIPEDEHAPLLQAFALLSAETPAMMFFDFVRTEQAHGVFRYYGFLQP